METHIAALVTYSWKASCLRGCMSVWVKENREIASQGHRGLKHTSTTPVRRGVLGTTECLLLSTSHSHNSY